MKIISREYDPDNDFERVRTFLIDTFEITKSFQNWLPDRFENSLIDNEDGIIIWEKQNEDDEAEIVAVANPESLRAYYIQIHPEYKYLEREIVERIEKHFKTKGDDPIRKVKRDKLHLFSIEGDLERESLLTELGYKKCGISGINRSRSLDLPIPEVEVPEGYTIRAIKRSDYDQLAAAIRLIFGHGEWFTAEILQGIARCSFHKQDLDLVAIAPDGTIASFCTFRMDPVSKITSLEPMGTHPDHRKLSLAKILIYEGLRRAMKYNPRLFYIDEAADTPAANQLYESVGFSKHEAKYYWRKDF